MNLSNVIDVDNNYDDDNPVAAWYKLNKSNDFSQTKFNDEKNLSLRVQDSKINLPGIIKYNSQLSKFQGYTGDLALNSDGWTTFQTFSGIDGVDGKESIEEVTGTNKQIPNDSELFGIFSSVEKTQSVNILEATNIQTNNLVNNIFSIPAYQYSTFGYSSTSTRFDLENKNITFIPNDNSSYKIFVRNNDIYPKVEYYQHNNVEVLNGKKILLDNYYPIDFSNTNTQFKFYGENFRIIYVHENGYLNFDNGNTSLLQNRYGNHFINYRLSFLMGDLINKSVFNSQETNRCAIYIDRGKYNELVITYNNISANIIDNTNSNLDTLTNNNLSNVQIRLWLSDSDFTDYPEGTMQIIYGKCEFKNPLIGLSDKSIYNELSFVPLRFDTLLDFKFDQTKGLGVPEIEAELLCKISNDTSRARLVTINSILKAQTQNELIQYNSDNVYILKLRDTNFTTFYSEKINGVIYYTKIYNLGNIIIDKFILAMGTLSLYDIDEDMIETEMINRLSYSDSASLKTENGGSVNLMTNKDKQISSETIKERDIYNISNFFKDTNKNTDFLNDDNFITINSGSNDVYNNNSSDYKTVYTRSNTKELYNSFIHKVEFTYSPSNNEGNNSANFSFTNLYDGNVSNNLLIKIVYGLNSNIDNRNNNSFDNFYKINEDNNGNLQELFTQTNIDDNNVQTTLDIINKDLKSKKFNYIEGYDDYYKFRLKNNHIVKLSLDDSSNILNGNSRYNSLKFAIYSENIVNGLITRELVGEINTTSENKYPEFILENTVNKELDGDIKDYYIVVNSNITNYFYTIKFTELSTAIAVSQNRILRIFIKYKDNNNLFTEILNNLSINNQITLRTNIKNKLNSFADSGNNKLLRDTNTKKDIYEIILTGGNLLATVYFNVFDSEFTETKFQAILTALNNSGNGTEIDYISTENRKAIITSNEISVGFITTVELPDLIDDIFQTSQQSSDDNQDIQNNKTSNFINYSKFTGLLHSLNNSIEPDIYRKTSVSIGDNTYFCILQLETGEIISGGLRTYKVKLIIQANDTAELSKTELIDEFSLDQNSNLKNFPINIYQTSGKNLEVTVLYTKFDEFDNKIIIISKYRFNVIQSVSNPDIIFTKQEFTNLTPIDMFLSQDKKNISLSYTLNNNLANVKISDTYIHSFNDSLIYNFYYIYYHNNKLGIYKIDEDNNIYLYLSNFYLIDTFDNLEYLQLDVDSTNLNILTKETGYNFKNYKFNINSPLETLNNNSLLPLITPSDKSAVIKTKDTGSNIFIVGKINDFSAGYIDNSNIQNSDNVVINNVKTIVSNKKKNLQYTFSSDSNDSNFFQDFNNNNIVSLTDVGKISFENNINYTNSFYLFINNSNKIQFYPETEITLNNSSSDTVTNIKDLTNVTDVFLKFDINTKIVLALKNEGGTINKRLYLYEEYEFLSTTVNDNTINTTFRNSNIDTVFESGIGFVIKNTLGEITFLNSNLGEQDFTTYDTVSSQINNRTILNILGNDGAFAVLVNESDSQNLFTWGKNQFGGTINLNSNDQATIISNVASIYKNNIAFALVNKTRKVHSWGSNISSIILSNLNTDILNANIKEVFSTSVAFAALQYLQNGGNVLTWGGLSELPNSYQYNFGQEKSYITPDNNQNYTDISSELTNIETIYSNSYSFVAKKKITDDTTGNITYKFIPWGYNKLGGSPFRENLSSVWEDISDNLDDISEHNFLDIISNDGAYTLLKKDGSVVCWGNINYGGTNPIDSNFIEYDDFVKIQSTSKTFIGFRVNGEIVVWGDNLEGNSNIEEINNDTNVLINKNPNLELTVSNDNILNNTKFTFNSQNIIKTEVNKCIKYNNGNIIFFTKTVEDGVYKYNITRKNNSSSSNLTVISINNDINITFSEFEAYTFENKSYLKILSSHKSNGSNNKTIFVFNIKDGENISKVIEISNDSITFLSNILYNTFLYLIIKTENKIQIKKYNIENGNVIETLPTTDDADQLVRQNYGIYEYTYFIDFVNNSIRFYFISYIQNSTNNKLFDYHVHLFRKNKNRSVNNNFLPQLENNYQKIDKINYIDNLENENIKYLKKVFINDDYNLIIKLEDNILILELFNNNYFYNLNIYNLEENETFERILDVKIINNIIYIFKLIDNFLIISKNEINNDLSNIKLNGNKIKYKKISNIMSNNNDIYFTLYDKNIFIYKLSKDLKILKQFNIETSINSNIHIINNDNLLNIFIENINNYYICNLNNLEIEKKYTTDLIILNNYHENSFINNNNFEKILKYKNENYYISFENNTFNVILKRCNKGIYIIHKYNSLEDLKLKFKIHNFIIYGNNLYLVYENNYEEGNSKRSKNIIKYNLINDNIFINTFKFDIFKVLYDNIILIDLRNIYKTISVRYLDDELEYKNLNIYKNEYYTYDKLVYYYSDGRIYFIGINGSDINIYNYENNTNGEIIKNYDFLEEKNILDEFNNFKTLFRTHTTNNETLENETKVAVKVVSIQLNGVSVDNNYYIFNQDDTNSKNHTNINYELGTGTYIIKNIPKETPIAIISNNNSLINYKGLSYNNLDNIQNVYQRIVNERNLDNSFNNIQGLYNFYYGDIEINVLGDFGHVYYESYHTQDILDKNKFKYKNTLSSDLTENKLYIDLVNTKINRLIIGYGDTNNSNYIIGQVRNETYSTDDSGVFYYTYNRGYYKDNEFIYINTNSIPNYTPTYKTNIIKGNWKNDTTNGTDNYYAIGLTNHGYIDSNYKQQGTPIKIKIEPLLSLEKNYTINYTNSSSTIRERFWYEGDIYWNSLMDDTKYNSIKNMLVPMGPIGITLNGVSIYNFAVQTNTIKNTFNSDNTMNENLNYSTELTNGKYYNVINAFDNEIADNQTGYVDLNNNYHYHTYPITLEGQLTFGTLNNNDGNSSIRLLGNIISNQNIELFLGHTYYFNQSHISNLNNSLNFKEIVDSSEIDYTFENTIIYNGIPGTGHSYVKFIVPSSLTKSNIKMINKNKTLNTFYNFNNKIKNKIVKYNISIENGKFIIKNENNSITYDNSIVNSNTVDKQLYFEINVKYELIYTNINTNLYKIGLETNNNNFIIVTNDTNNKKFTFIIKELVDNVVLFNAITDSNGNFIKKGDTSNSKYFIINVVRPNSINYYILYNSSNSNNLKYDIYESMENNTSDGNTFKYNGSLEYEDAYEYLIYRKTQKLHSPLLGYAFDGYPIYGPLGYSTDDDTKNTLKFLTSSYTDELDENNNKQYVKASGDLDICNGIFRRTPEYPNGIYHYIFTIETNNNTVNNLPIKRTDTNKYGYRNINRFNLIKPSFPYCIGAFKGIPCIDNFKYVSLSNTITTTLQNKVKYNINLKSLKSGKNNFLNEQINSVGLSSDDNYIYLKNNNLPYVWNLTNSVENVFFGQDNRNYFNKIPDLKSNTDSDIFKAYGKVSKYICSEPITKGTAVRFSNSIINNVNTLCVETYEQIISVSEEKKGASFLGIALNDTTNIGDTVYVCQSGITTIKLGNTINQINCGSYGVLAFSSSNGEVIALGNNFLISFNTPVAGYFLEDITTEVTKGTYVLFYVQSNFEFN